MVARPRAGAAQKTPAVFDRTQIRAWIEEATGEGLSVEDSLPDTLAATAEALGLQPAELKLWCYESQHAWTSADLAE